jgi:hypothetical protein
MSWTWRYETATGEPAVADGLPHEVFPTQADAESWLGEQWRELVAGGVDQVSLLDDGGVVYGPMSLHPAN